MITALEAELGWNFRYRLWLIFFTHCQIIFTINHKIYYSRFIILSMKNLGVGSVIVYLLMGSVIVKVAPSPSALSSFIVPLCEVIISLEMDKPNPVPPLLLVV